MIRAAILALALLVSGPAVADDDARSYESDGLTFQRPAGWSVTDDTAIADIIRIVTIESADAIILIWIADSDDAEPLLEFAENFHTEMREGSPFIARIGEATFGEIADTPEGEALISRAKMRMFGLYDEKHRADYERRPMGDQVIFLVLAGLEDDFPALLPDYELVGSTLAIAE